MSNLVSRVFKYLKKGKGSKFLSTLGKIYSFYIHHQTEEKVNKMEKKLFLVDKKLLSIDNSLDFLDKNIHLLWEAHRIQHLLHKQNLSDPSSLFSPPPKKSPSRKKNYAPNLSLLPQKEENSWTSDFLKWLGKSLSPSLVDSLEQGLWDEGGEESSLQEGLLSPNRWEVPLWKRGEKKLSGPFENWTSLAIDSHLLPFQKEEIWLSLDPEAQHPSALELSGTREPYSSLEVGDQVGLYRLEKHLGQGPNGEMWKAIHIKSQEPFTLKTFSHPQFLAPFQRFSPIYNHFIRNPEKLPSSFLKIYEVEKTPHPYLVMEWFEGHSLAKVLQQGPLPVGQALRIGEKISLAVRELHKHHLLHLNLKPTNVLLKGDEIRICDFGLDPWRTYLSSGWDDLPGKPGIEGALAYLSPEQKHERLDLDRRSDIYQIGLLLFEMLTGRIPGPGMEYPNPLILSPTPIGFLETLEDIFHHFFGPRRDRFPTISAYLPILRRMKHSFVAGFDSQSIRIPGGVITLGKNSGELPSQKPEVVARLDHFVLDRHSVTVAEYLQFIEERGYEIEILWGKDGWKWLETEDFSKEEFLKLNTCKTDPVRGVNWYEARAFARWMGKRLPTSAEWETAARYYRDQGYKEEFKLLFDGLNWCLDSFDPYHYQKCKESGRNAALPPASKTQKVVRGRPHGGYPPRISLRLGMKPEKRDRTTGIRLAVDLDFKKKEPLRS